MNRTAPGAAEALGSAFPSILREGPASFSDWEAVALELVRVAFPGYSYVLLEAPQQGAASEADPARLDGLTGSRVISALSCSRFLRLSPVCLPGRLGELRVKYGVTECYGLVPAWIHNVVWR